MPPIPFRIGDIRLRRYTLKSLKVKLHVYNPILKITIKGITNKVRKVKTLHCLSFKIELFNHVISSPFSFI